jgi:hypothetical protein
VLCHDGNVFATIPVAHSIHLREMWQLEASAEQCELQSTWIAVYGDFKVTALLLGLQVDYITTPSFLCRWDSRAKSEQWERHGWPPQKSFDSGVSVSVSTTDAVIS